MRNARNQYLNILEAAAAFFVVFIHFPFPGAFGEIVTALSRFAVPLFFVISGYFLYRGNPTKEMASIPRKVKRLAKTILMSETFYYLWSFLVYADNYGITIKAAVLAFTDEFTRNYLPNLPSRLLALSPVLNGVAWFMTSLIVVYCIFYGALKFHKLQLIRILSVFGVIFGMVLARVNSIICLDMPETFEHFMLFLPLPFFTFGYYAGMWKDRLLRYEPHVYLIVALVGVFLTLAEHSFGYTYTIYFGTPLFVFGSFLFTLKVQPRRLGVVGRYLSMIGEKCGTWIYILHNIVGYTAQVMLPRIFPEFADHKLYGLLFPIILCLGMCILSQMIVVCTSYLARVRGS